MRHTGWEIGRRTGVQIIQRKRIRIEYDGTDVFDDYWTDSEVEASTVNESTLLQSLHTISTLSSNIQGKEPSVPFKKPTSTSTKKSFGISSGFAEEETLPLVTNDTLILYNPEEDYSQEKHASLRDFSVQTSRVFDTPISRKVTPRNSSSKKRFSFKKGKSETAKSTKRESKNRSFAGERTWLDKSCNTSNFSKEQSIQTSQKKSSTKRKSGKDRNGASRSKNALKEIQNLQTQSSRRSLTLNKSTIISHDPGEHKSKVSEAQISTIGSTSKDGKSIQNATNDGLLMKSIQNASLKHDAEKSKVDGPHQGIPNNFSVTTAETKDLQRKKELNSARESIKLSFCNKQTASKECKSTVNSPRVLDSTGSTLQATSAERKNSPRRSPRALDQKDKTPQNLLSNLTPNVQLERLTNLPPKNSSVTGAATDEKSKSDKLDTVAESHSKQGESTTSANSPTKSPKQNKIESAVDNLPSKKSRKRKKYTDDREKSAANTGEPKNGQAEDNCGIRKSKRNRIPPLDFWRNQRRLFRNTESGNVTFVELAEGTEEDRQPLEKVARYQKRLSQKVSRPSSDPSNFTSMNEEANIWHKPLERIKWFPFNQNDGKPAYNIGKTLKDKDQSFGFIEILPGRKKEEQYSPAYSVYFTVVKGHVDLSVNKTVLKLGPCDSTVVPVDVAYSIYNPGRSKALISFCIRKQPFF